MAKIKINFDKKSIQEAIKQLKDIKKKMQKDVPSLFVTRCLEWIRDRANEYLSNIDMSGAIISNIQSSWEIQPITNNSMKLVNSSNKAVFVEFGVGKVGQSQSHPNAGVENYEYNVESGKKDKYGRWRFRVNESLGVDLVVGNYTQDGETITTMGSPSTLYLYNAGMDLMSTGVYKDIWNKVLNDTI